MYVLALAGAGGVLALSNFFPAQSAAVRAGLSDALSPVLQLAVQPLRLAQAVGEGISRHFFIVSENSELRDENARLRVVVREVAALRVENDRLGRLLNMTKGKVDDPLAARVLIDGRSPYVRTLLIDAGKLNSVREGQAVLSDEGLVGRIFEAGQLSARVLLVSDYNARIPVRLLESGEQAILCGNNTPLLELCILDNDVRPRVGQTVVTSDIGGYFTAGVPVGKVISTSGGRTLVRPFVKFSALERVVVQRRDVAGLVVPDGGTALP